MSVTNDDVRHIAALARLGLEPDRVELLARELNGILAHMDVLAAVDTSAIDLHARAEGEGMPLRDDGAAPVAERRGDVEGEAVVAGPRARRAHVGARAVGDAREVDALGAGAQV